MACDSPAHSKVYQSRVIHEVMTGKMMLLLQIAVGIVVDGYLFISINFRGLREFENRRGTPLGGLFSPGECHQFRSFAFIRGGSNHHELPASATSIRHRVAKRPPAVQISLP